MFLNDRKKEKFGFVLHYCLCSPICLIIIRRTITTEEEEKKDSTRHTE